MINAVKTVQVSILANRYSTIDSSRTTISTYSRALLVNFIYRVTRERKRKISYPLSFYSLRGNQLTNVHDALRRLPPISRFETFIPSLSFLLLIVRLCELFGANICFSFGDTVVSFVYYFLMSNPYKLSWKKFHPTRILF